MKLTIIVVQTSHAAYMGCMEELEKMGLKRYKDFIVTDSKPDEEWFIPGMRQLLVTGSFCGDQEGVGEMVQKARDLNNDLVTVSFSLDVLDGPFDRHVRKSIGAQNQFRKIVTDFQNGTLVRTGVSWKPPEPFGVFSL